MGLAAFLAHHAIEAKRFEHPAVMTVEESERLVPRLPGAKTKNLLLRDRKGARHFLVTVPHDLAVDLNALGGQLGGGYAINIMGEADTPSVRGRKSVASYQARMETPGATRRTRSPAQRHFLREVRQRPLDLRPALAMLLRAMTMKARSRR